MNFELNYGRIPVSERLFEVGGGRQLSHALHHAFENRGHDSDQHTRRNGKDHQHQVETGQPWNQEREFGFAPRRLRDELFRESGHESRQADWKERM